MLANPPPWFVEIIQDAPVPRNPRTKVAALAYINFEPNNGGIELNVSEGGLCFHAVTPLQLDGTLRFWFSAEGRRVEANGELAWTDETRKAGGLRFGILPAEVRVQVRGWMNQCAILSAAEETSPRAIAPAHQSAQFRAGLLAAGTTAQTLGVVQVIAKPLTRDALLGTVNAIIGPAT